MKSMVAPRLLFHRRFEDRRKNLIDFFDDYGNIHLRAFNHRAWGEKEVKKEGSVWRDESSSSKREERSPRKSVKESR